MLHLRQNEGDSSSLVSNLYITKFRKKCKIDKSLVNYIEEKKKKEMVYI